MKIKNIIFTYTSFLKEIDLNTTSFLQDLNIFSKENNINLYLVTGLREEVGKEIVIKNKLSSFFKETNIYHVTDKYLFSLSEMDQEIRLEKYKLEKDFVDQYFKIHFLKEMKSFLNTKETLLIGEDVWTDAYYSVEFSSVEILLIKPKITFNKEEYLQELKTIPCINLNFEELKEYLLLEKENDYSKLKSFAKNYLMNKSIGKLNLNIDFNKLYKKKEE